jgi:hypothetical protein
VSGNDCDIFGRPQLVLMVIATGPTATVTISVNGMAGCFADGMRPIEVLSTPLSQSIIVVAPVTDWP